MDQDAGSYVASRVTRHFGIHVVGVEPVGLGADARADLWQVTTPDGLAYAAKRSSGAQPGLAVAASLAALEVPGVPSPVRTRDGALTALDDGPGTGDPQRFSLVPWVRGPRVLDARMTRGGWEGLGEVLGTLHTAPTSAPGMADVPVARPDPTAIVAQARAFGEVLAQARAAVPQDPVVAEMSALWLVDGPRVRAVADRAQHLATSPAWSTTSRVLCHGDPHHGNVLVDAQGQVWLIDWDDACLAPREADLMFVVGGVFSHAPITDEQVRWFFAGYTPITGTGPEDLDPDLLTSLRCGRALVDVLDLAVAAIDSAAQDEASRRVALGHLRRTLGPHGLATLALG